MKVVLKNNKLQVRINFTDPSLGVKEGGRIFRWKDTFEEANLFLLSWENDQLVEDHKIHKVNTRLYSYELEEAERAFALLKTNYMHSTNVLTDAVKFYVEHHKHTKAMHLKNAFDKLPSPTFVKGYISNIARTLNIDDRPIVAGYMQLFRNKSKR